MATTAPEDDELIGPQAALLASPVRRRIVERLSESPALDPDQGVAVRGRTAAELAAELSLHVTTVRFHLDLLVAAGLVDAEFTRAFGVGRPRKVYSVVEAPFRRRRDGVAVRMLTELLTASFGADRTPHAVGEAWSREHVAPTGAPPARTRSEWFGKLGQVLDVLETWGYTPELSTGDGGVTARIDLRHCPFQDLAAAHQEVVCGIHRGLIRGALAQLGEPQAHVALQPFVEPQLCQAHLTVPRPLTTDRRTP